MQKLNKITTKVLPQMLADVPALILAVMLVVVPLLVLPLGDNLIAHTKNLAVFIFGFIFIFAFVKIITKTHIFRIIASPFLGVLSLFLVSSFLSSMVVSDFPVMQFAGRGGTLIVLSLVGILGASVISSKSRHFFSLGLSIVAVILSFLTALGLAGFSVGQPLFALFGLEGVNVPTFHLTGSALITTQLTLVALVTTVAEIRNKSKLRTWYMFATPIILVGLGISARSLLPNQPSAYVPTPLSASWNIAYGTLQSPKSAFVGVGPESYQVAWQLFKPQSINATQHWATRFSQGINAPLTLLTTQGLLGLMAWIFLLIQSVKAFPQTSKENKPVVLALLTTVALQIFFPTNTVLLVVQILAIVFWVATHQKKFASIELHPLQVKIASAGKDGAEQKVSQYSKTFSYLLATIVVAGVGLSGYGLSKVYAAHYFIFKANTASIKNDIVSVYDYQRRAVVLNPYYDVLRRSHAVTNLAIANALARQEDKTEKQNQQISQLVQTAIREGRAATELDPRNSTNWQVLGDIYSQLIGSAEGAANWSITSYTNAIDTNPNNPVLRVQLGGVYLGQKEFQQAVSLFDQASKLKPDYANAYYNLANAFVELGQAEEASRFYQLTMELVEADSDNYKRIREEVDNLDERVAAAQKRRQAEAQKAQEAAAAAQKQQQALEGAADQVNIQDENITEPNEPSVVTPSEQVNIAPPAEAAPTATPSPEPSPQASPDSTQP